MEEVNLIKGAGGIAIWWAWLLAGKAGASLGRWVLSLPDLFVPSFP